LYRYRDASLLNYDIFIQPGTPSNWSKCQMYNNNENWSYFVSDILIYLGKQLKIISLFPQNLGVQRRPFFVLGASQDAWTPFWLKACMHALKCATRLSLTTCWQTVELQDDIASVGTTCDKSVELNNLVASCQQAGQREVYWSWPRTGSKLIHS
jgi:hypothetical protein